MLQENEREDTQQTTSHPYNTTMCVHLNTPYAIGDVPIHNYFQQMKTIQQ